MQTGGHQEVHGETIAKFEFHDAGFNPFSHYLDTDKVDLILRRKDSNGIHYREVQVKFGRLYPCGPAWERKLFDVTSWRFFDRDAFADHRPDLFVAYVLSDPGEGYKGDIFIFPSKTFHELIRAAIPVKNGEKMKMYLSRAKADKLWYLRRKTKFDSLTAETVVPIEEFRRNFKLLH